MLFADNWKMSPFEVLQQDVDDFSVIANYLIKLSRSKKETVEQEKINDGFWDF